MIMALATIVMAIATVCLAIFACQSNKLAMELKRTNDLKEIEDKEFKQQISDLYQAMVVAMIVDTAQGANRTQAVINCFKQYYKGKTIIFG